MKITVKTISDILEQTELTTTRVLRENNIKIVKIRSIFSDEKPYERRDEFYKLFKSEDTADHWWSALMDKYLDENGFS